MAMTVGDILMNADAFMAAYPAWPSAGQAWDPETAQAALEKRRAAERETAAALTGWLESQSIAKDDAAAKVAEALSESSLMRADIAVLLAGGDASQALRDAAVSLASVADIDPAERAADRYWHGHGKRTCRLGEVVND